MEKVETINQRLLETYGTSWNNLPMWRIVFADDQIEKRLVEYENGIQLLYPEFREVKKYQHIVGKFVLEDLVEVPEHQQKELGKQISYEPKWTFEDKFGNPLPPNWQVCQIVIASIEAAKGKTSHYKVCEKGENREEAIKKLELELYGDDTKVSDALSYGSGIAVPNNFERSN